MHEQGIKTIALIMVFVGGFFISVTVYGFILFARFLDREKLAAERFRAEVQARKARQSTPKDPDQL